MMQHYTYFRWLIHFLIVNLLAQKISEASKVDYLSKAKSSSFQYFGLPIGTVYIITFVDQVLNLVLNLVVVQYTSMSISWSNVYCGTPKRSGVGLLYPGSTAKSGMGVVQLYYL